MIKKIEKPFYTEFPIESRNYKDFSNFAWQSQRMPDIAKEKRNPS
ncbi:hypothetical protein EVA_21630 [gut metagenome]|uniref:Uncharacterized protein n=1 Tax=gut metagenome TaxID=749906 RepID=J9F5U1_9ZZZZ